MQDCLLSVQFISQLFQMLYGEFSAEWFFLETWLAKDAGFYRLVVKFDNTMAISSIQSGSSGLSSTVDI